MQSHSFVPVDSVDACRASREEFHSLRKGSVIGIVHYSSFGFEKVVVYFCGPFVARNRTFGNVRGSFQCWKYEGITQRAFFSGFGNCRQEVHMRTSD